MTQAAVTLPDGMDARQLTELAQAVSGRLKAVQHVQSAVASLPHALGPATLAQIGMVDSLFRTVEAEHGVLTSAEFAELVGGSPTSRSLATRARKRGMVGFARQGRLLYPAFQITRNDLDPTIGALSSRLRAAGWSDEDIILWWVSPNGWLEDDATPLAAFRAEEDDKLSDAADQAIAKSEW